MRTALSDQLGLAHPIFAFTPSEHVAAAVSRAGGMGVLGCVRFNDAEELDAVLNWMDENTDGKPYGVDIVMPAKVPTEGTPADLAKYIPDEHRRFVSDTLHKLGVPPLPADGDPAADGVLGWLHSVARAHVEVALHHPIKLIANALGSPPKDVIDQAHERDVPVAALAGKAKHARAHVDNGVDIVIAQGTEAGGHTGEIATMVLVPEIVDAVGTDGAVLAAGGIGSGRQIAAALALGAAGVWMGSYWLTASEYTLGAGDTMQRALVSAGSDQTVRSRIYSGKPARLLKTKWTDAWSEPGAPEPLPMPLQNLLVTEAHQRIMRSQDPEVVAMPVGQIVGRMNSVRPAAELVHGLVAELEETLARLDKLR
ncbi:MAG: nitronate monooxygenase [Actinomycetota bacterium]|nr:nitronate monooxygenase [Actinomycetota bacterium]